MAQVIASRQARPGLGWYDVAIAIAVFGVLTSIGSFVMGFTTGLTGWKPALSVDSDGSEARVRLVAGHEYAVYLSVNSTTSCTATPSTRVHLSPAALPDTFITYGWSNSTMKVAYQLSATTTGIYQVACHDDPFSIGKRANVGPLVGGFGFMSVALLGPVGMSLLAAALIGLVGRVRRDRYRDHRPQSGTGGGWT